MQAAKKESGNSSGIASQKSFPGRSVRSLIRERLMAGLSRAKADGTQLGRRRLEDTDADKVAAIVAARATGGSGNFRCRFKKGNRRCFIFASRRQSSEAASTLPMKILGISQRSNYGN